MDIDAWVALNSFNHGELLILVGDVENPISRMRRESQIRFHALHELNTRWVKEALYELKDHTLLDTTEYLDIRLRDMSELN